jgi:hypothetical protein
MARPSNPTDLILSLSKDGQRALPPPGIDFRFHGNDAGAELRPCHMRNVIPAKAGISIFTPAA